MIKIVALIILIGLVKTFYSCDSNYRNTNYIKTDTTIHSGNAINTLYLDSIQLANFIKQHQYFKQYYSIYFDFYASRNYQYAWFDSSGLTQQAHYFINLLQTTVTSLQDSSVFNEAFLKVLPNLTNEHATSTEILNEELTLTGQFFHYAMRVYKGSNINAKELGWYIPRKKINIKNLLVTALQTDTLSVLHYAPLNSMYYKLQSLLPLYYKLMKEENWSTIVIPKKEIKLGDTSSTIKIIKHRLKIMNDATCTISSTIFDTCLWRAIQVFQQRMGLIVNGKLNKATIQQLNITPAKRIQQILINLERLRWMPAATDSNYIIINIPEYKMHVLKNGKQLFDMNVIVGTAANNTVIFNGSIQYIVFSPYWNIPQSITIKEIIPAIKKQKNYLTQHHMEIVGYYNDVPIIRQKPGAANALGLVKFLFPNSHNIYLHDTPFKNLFSENTRTFSHGCIRIADAKKFAQYLLSADTAVAWKSNTIDSCMHLSTEKWVTLTKQIPIAIVYFTTWVDANGKLNFRNDIYKHDQKLAAKMFIQ